MHQHLIEAPPPDGLRDVDDVTLKEEEEEAEATPTLIPRFILTTFLVASPLLTPPGGGWGSTNAIKVNVSIFCPHL
jgi:hypothetical protein